MQRAPEEISSEAERRRNQANLHWSEQPPNDGGDAPTKTTIIAESMNRGMFDTRYVCSRCNRLADPFCSCSRKLSLFGAEGALQYSEKTCPLPSSNTTLSLPPLVQDAFKSTPKKRALKDAQPPHDVSQAKKQAFLVQSYQDHAADPIAPEYSPGSSGTFPFILHAMLSEVEEIGLANIVSFRPHGRAFMVHQPDAFVESVMPLYFQQTQLSSFVRQLNLYGFIRLNGGKDHGSYYHPYFLRDRVDLCYYIQRTRVKGGVSPNIPSRQPDLRNLPQVGKGKGTNMPMAMVGEVSTGEERTPITPDAKDRSSTALLSEELAPRPLPPFFNDRPFSSLQVPGYQPTTRVLDIGHERWVFHLSSTRMQRNGTSSPSQPQNVPGVAVSTSTVDSHSDENELHMSLGPSVGQTLPVASELVGGEESDGDGVLQSSETTSNSSRTDSSFSRLIDHHILDKDQAVYSHEEREDLSTSPIDLQWD